MTPAEQFLAKLEQAAIAFEANDAVAAEEAIESAQAAVKDLPGQLLDETQLATARALEHRCAVAALTLGKSLDEALGDAGRSTRAREAYGAGR